MHWAMTTWTWIVTEHAVVACHQKEILPGLLEREAERETSEQTCAANDNQ